MTARRIDTVRSTLRMVSVAVLLLPASTALAAKIDITPAISLDQVYDSNVFNTDGNEKEDFLFRATPAVTFSLKMPETTLHLRSSITLDTYYKYTELNSSDSAITLALESRPPIRLTPRLSIAPSGHFVQARNSFLRSQMVPTADPLAPPSIAAESATQKSRDYGAALLVNYLLTEKTELSLGGRFSKLQFLDNTASGNVDSRVIGGDTSLTYKFTPLFSAGLFFNTTYNTFENGTDSRVYAGGLTGSYRFSPTFTVDARAGATHMKETSTTGSETKETSPYGALSLVYSERDLRVALSGAIEQAGGGNLGVTTRRETVSLAVSDQFAARWWADIGGTYQVNRPLENDVSGDLTSTTGTARIRHQPLEWLEVHLSGSGLRQSGEGVLGTDLTRYSAFFGVTLSKTFNIY